MQIGAILKSFIYLISSSLLYPILILLSLLSVWVLIQSGSFFAEWLERARLNGNKERVWSIDISDIQQPHRFSHRLTHFLNGLTTISNNHDDPELQMEFLLQEETARLHHSLDSARLVARVGPGLGLIGTLIPMGTGLAGLSQGDMTQLTSDLVIAFTTTVVGLASGLLAYFFFLIRHKWVQEDIRVMEYVAEIWLWQRKQGRTHALPQKTTL